MRIQRFPWEGFNKTGPMLREWSSSLEPDVDVGKIFDRVVGPGSELRGGKEVIEEALLELTNQFDATEIPLTSVKVDSKLAEDALERLDPTLRGALDIAAANVQAVSEAQLSESRPIHLPQGHTVTLREVPVGGAGIYAPGGRAAYFSSVLMCAIPARVAGVERIALASPPGPDGNLHPLVLAAAALCRVDEIYAMGGAQAIFALAYGFGAVAPVDVIAGPGNAWVRAAKRAVYGQVGIDSLAGPSELMVIVDPATDPEWVALDLCAQAEHGPDSPLVVVGIEGCRLDEIAAATEKLAANRSSVADAPLALVEPPVQGGDIEPEWAIELANVFAPEHLELLSQSAEHLADRVTSAGCVFLGDRSATAFGDYVAGSNHVLPTGRAGRFSGPLGPATFRRRISEVEIGAEAAQALAPQANALARAEGFPVHGESAMIRR